MCANILSFGEQWRHFTVAANIRTEALLFAPIRAHAVVGKVPTQNNYKRVPTVRIQHAHKRSVRLLYTYDMNIEENGVGPILDK